MKFESLKSAASGRTLHYVRQGQGQPLLYLHGMLGLTACAPLLETLARTFDVIAPCAPGWGPARDELPTVDPGPLDLTLHLIDVLDGLAVERAAVAGVGIGAWMGAELAAIAPHRVERLLLVNPLGLWLEATPGEDPFAVHPGMPSEILFTEPGQRKKYLFEGRDKVDAHVEELLNLRAAAKFLWPIPDTGISRRMGRIKAPTLIVTCEHDRIVPAAYGPAWQHGIARAELAVLANAGHVPEIEQPAALAELAAGFLATRPVAAVA